MHEKYERGKKIMLKTITKIILVFAFATTASACGYAAYSHQNPVSLFHILPEPKPQPPQNGKIDLKIDSACHYYQLDPQNPLAFASGDLKGYFDAGCTNGGKSFGTWPAKDLTSEKFFNFPDLKPGDAGEDTVSIHLSGDDACGRMEIDNVKDYGNTCTEPETQSSDPDCKGKAPGSKEQNGEMGANLEYSVWVDQGDIPGFQGRDKDPHEGDNIFNGKDYKIFDWQAFKGCPKVISLKSQIQKVRNLYKNDCDAKTADADGDGDSKNKVCEGFPRDGHLMKDVVYYIGLSWRLPASVGNDVQSDGLSFDVKFIGTAKDNCDSHDFSCGQCKDGCDECDKDKCPGH